MGLAEMVHSPRMNQKTWFSNVEEHPAETASCVKNTQYGPKGKGQYNQTFRERGSDVGY